MLNEVFESQSLTISKCYLRKNFNQINIVVASIDPHTVNVMANYLYATTMELYDGMCNIADWNYDHKLSEKHFERRKSSTLFVGN